VDMVTRKAAAVLVKLASDSHLGLAVSVNYILDPLITSLAAAASNPSDCERPGPTPEAAAVVARVAERVGEPTVGDAIMPRLLALLAPASLAFPNANMVSISFLNSHIPRLICLSAYLPIDQACALSLSPPLPLSPSPSLPHLDTAAQV